eukprot:607066-Prorocentrum_minimum.AAC.2
MFRRLHLNELMDQNPRSADLSRDEMVDTMMKAKYDARELARLLEKAAKKMQCFRKTMHLVGYKDNSASRHERRYERTSVHED